MIAWKLFVLDRNTWNHVKIIHIKNSYLKL